MTTFINTQGTYGPVGGTYAGTQGTYGPMSFETGGGMVATVAEPRKVNVRYPSICSCSCLPIWIWFLTTTLLALVLILIMQQLNLGRRVESEGVSFNVHVGTSLDSATKCVEAPAGVHCQNNVVRKGTDGLPDQFHVYHDGLGKICARRVDHPDPWGLDLTLACAMAPTSVDETARVYIGNTLAEHTNTKCVDAPPNVVCDNSAPQLGRTGQWQDTFDVYQKNGQVCAHRTDRPTSWGLDLVLQCRKGSTSRSVSFTDITIGNTLSTHTDEKCVEDPGTVNCDNDAEQVGRDGKWKDKFNIFHKDGKICADRIDSPGAWGLNLVLRCKNKLQSD